ncbi:MAG: hypothetical protein AB7O32_12950 [Vicinamibacterales bacterium]
MAADMSVDTTQWSGEGDFTQRLLERLQRIESIAFVRVEDAPATRSDADYNFISNEIYVAFGTRSHKEPIRRLGFLPGTRVVTAKAMSVVDLELLLTETPDIGAPDYADEGMLQYMRTERIIPPYQTRGYKLVELVRLYEVGTAPRR